jgi:hypothetical protein
MTDDFDEENNPSAEEQVKIEEIKIRNVKHVNSSNWFSMFFFMPKINNYVIKTRQPVAFDPVRRVGISKVVTINNISGKNAWLILSPGEITRLGSISIDKIGQITLVTTGECKTQQCSIPNNSSGEYDLDNSLTYVSLFLHIDNKWKKVWLDRLFNTRKCNINILEKHVLAAVDYTFDS